MKRSIFVSLTIAFLIFANFPALSFTPPNPAIAQGRGGAVASVDRDATKIGINVLKAGGNAILQGEATPTMLRWQLPQL
jgi:gamma-glutamyltranspeptidase / glutathione hydrolase